MAIPQSQAPVAGSVETDTEYRRQHEITNGPANTGPRGSKALEVLNLDNMTAQAGVGYCLAVIKG